MIDDQASGGNIYIYYLDFLGLYLNFLDLFEFPIFILILWDFICTFWDLFEFCGII
jgi:hypothetical protein